VPEDKTLQCRDCGEEFVFTAGEQEFFSQRGFSEPIRCKSCRDARKAEKANRNSSGGFGGRGGRDRW